MILKNVIRRLYAKYILEREKAWKQIRKELQEELHKDLQEKIQEKIQEELQEESRCLHRRLRLM